MPVHYRSPTPNHKRQKSGARRARQNKTPRSDAITLTGRQRIAILSSSSGTLDYSFAVTPSALGDRVAAVSAWFSRFRFNSLRFELRSKLGTTTQGTIVAGVLDDINTSLAALPPEILDYRISMERHVFQDLVLKWSPIDKSKWYYIASGQSPNDVRDAYPCTFYVTSEDQLPGGSVAVSLYSFDLYYSITLEGATNNLVSVTDPDYVSLPPTPSGIPVPPLQNPTRRR